MGRGEGCAEGRDVGVCDGSPVGETVGAVRDKVGLMVGLDVVGDTVGAVGAQVGDGAGSENVGDSDGNANGDAVGSEMVDDWVWDLVGSEVVEDAVVWCGMARSRT